jgi:outer membrane protein insertion porin family
LKKAINIFHQEYELGWKYHLSFSILQNYLGIKKGDIYNQKQLEKRLTSDNDAMGNCIPITDIFFYSCTPIEIKTQNDSHDLEMRIFEGKQATIDRIIIEGNTKTHEHVARRELYTIPVIFSARLIDEVLQAVSTVGVISIRKELVLTLSRIRRRYS